MPLAKGVLLEELVHGAQERRIKDPEVNGQFMYPHSRKLLFFAQKYYDELEAKIFAICQVSEMDGLESNSEDDSKAKKHALTALLGKDFLRHLTTLCNLHDGQQLPNPNPTKPPFWVPGINPTELAGGLFGAQFREYCRQVVCKNNAKWLKENTAAVVANEGK